MFKNLLKYSIAFGFHVGKDVQYFNYKFSSIILGYSNGFAIFNLNKVVNSLQNVVRFLKHASPRGSSILYHVSSLFLYDFSIRLAFTTLCAFTTTSVIIDTEWRPGYLHSKNISFFKLVSSLYESAKASKNWLDLLVRLLSYLYLSRLSGIHWSYHASKIAKFFKMFLFFKYFKSYFKLPEVFFLWNSLNYTHPILEMSRVRSSVISTVNTSDTLNNITYPIYLNGTSIWGAVLVFKMSISTSI